MNTNTIVYPVIFISALLFLNGCSSNKVVLLDTVFDLKSDYRIIKHDFSKKYSVLDHIPEKPKPFALAGGIIHPSTNLVKSLESLPSIEDDFFNESSVIKDVEITINKIIAELGKERLLIVGHSHGNSKVGVKKLAGQRADFILTHLMKRGVKEEEVYLMGAWSENNTNYSMKRGARVFSARLLGRKE